MEIKATVKISFITVAILVVIIMGANWIVLYQLKQNNIAQKNVVDLISTQEEMGILAQKTLDMIDSTEIIQLISEFSKEKNEFEEAKISMLRSMNKSIINFLVSDMQNSKEIYQGIKELLENEKNVEMLFLKLLNLQKENIPLFKEYQELLNKENNFFKKLKKKILDSKNEIIIAKYALLEHNREVALVEKTNRDSIEHWLKSIQNFEEKNHLYNLSEYDNYAQELSGFAIEVTEIKRKEQLYKKQLDKILEQNKKIGFIIEDIVETSLSKSIDSVYIFIVVLLIFTVNLVIYLAYRIYKNVGFSVDAIEEKVADGLSEIKQLNKEIEDTQREIVFTMGVIAEERSRETGQHVKRVAEYCCLLGKYYGLSDHECELLKQASPMHDIGKLAIPDAILTKDGRLTESEREIMNQHAYFGYTMLKHSDRELLKAAAMIAYEHHEKWDGSGYPNGLKGKEIHIFGRITALADVFDALGSERSYKKAWDDTQVFDYLREQSGKHLEPALVDIFFEHLDEFLVIREQLSDTFD